MKDLKYQLISKLEEVKGLYVELEDYSNANLIKNKILELENSEFNFTGNTGTINVAKVNSKINCVQNSL